MKESNVIQYVTEEVWRQGHDITTLDGIERVGWMLDGWSYALSAFPIRRPGIIDACCIGQRVEVIKNISGFRNCGVRIGSRICPDPKEVRPMLNALWLNLAELKPLEFYRQFEEIHPFVDGNGRTGKILLNWLNGTLANPIFPPHNFWGEWIQNP